MARVSSDWLHNDAMDLRRARPPRQEKPLTRAVARPAILAVIAAVCVLQPASAAPTIDRLPVSRFKVRCVSAGSSSVTWLIDRQVVGTGRSYRPAREDVGHRLTCLAGGRTSVPRQVAGQPTLGGIPLVGRIVACNPGKAMPRSVLPATGSYRWHRGARVIGKASSRRYRLRDLDGGRRITCELITGPASGVRSERLEVWKPPKIRGGDPGRAARCTPTWPRAAYVSFAWSVENPDGTWSRLPNIYGNEYPVSPAEPGGTLRCTMDAELFDGRHVRARSRDVELRAGWRPPALDGAWTARVFASETVARVRPSRSARRAGILSGESELLGGTKWVAVTDLRRRGGTIWAKVLLSSRPNGLQGWVSDEFLDFTFNPNRIVVDQSERTLSVYRSGRRRMVMPAGVGKPATPTPNGLFAIESHIPTPNEGAYGPMVLVLTGHSPVLYKFDGGDGRLAIHGTNKRSSVGRAESYGCVRLGNRNVLRLSKIVPDGTLMEIRE